jgi:D-alanyl-D-alanine carboxypeptidase
MTVRKFNYTKFIIFILIVAAILFGIIYGIVKLVSHINYTKTYEYKLLNIGYDNEEIEILTKKLNDDKLNELLKSEYNGNIVSFVKEKFFIYENLDKYLEYEKQNKDYDNSKIIAIINTEANVDWFEIERETDTSKGELMLVNRLYGLNSEYTPEDIVTIPSKYAYDNIKISNSILENIQEMAEDAKAEGYTFVVSSGFRTYKEQKSLYNSYASSYGKNEADKYVARAGHSEYETGLSFDFEPYKYTSKVSDIKTSAEYLWLRENAHKYGFIFRFESDKEYITGFSEDPWRLRYVGVDAADMIYNEKICFEEYYAYFVNRGE